MKTEIIGEDLDHLCPDCEDVILGNETNCTHCGYECD